MRPTPIWLSVGSALAVLAACSGGREGSFAPALVARGGEVFRSEGCVACHSSDRGGTAMAPPLHGLSRHWNETTLRAFLLDPPRTISGDSRLHAMAREYPAQMPALFARDSDRLDALVAYLLSTED